MSSISFSIVDVFSTSPYNGNPLAVVNDLSASLTETQMKLIARQFNLSETTFVNPPTVPNAAYRLRSFLPDGKEVFGAGHNSLGALWWLARHGHLDHIALAVDMNTAAMTVGGAGKALRFNQQMAQDALPVTTVVNGGNDSNISVTLRQIAPQFYGNPSGLAETLGVDASSVGFKIAGGTISTSQVVSTSSSRHLLVPLANEDVLNSIALVDRERLAREIRVADPLAYRLYLFTPQSQSQSVVVEGSEDPPTFVARFFSPGMSREDPATGSAAGPMAAYLHKHGVLKVAPGETRSVNVLQGLKAGRKCLLTLNVGQGKDEDSETSIELTGGGVEVMSGSAVVPASDIAF